MAKRPPPGRCVYCLHSCEELTWDHVLPEAWYPETTPANTEKWKVPACGPCNKAHGKNEADLLVRFGLCVAPDKPGNTGIADRALRALNSDVGKDTRDSNARASKRAQILKHAFGGPDIPRQAIYPGFGPRADMNERDQVAITISTPGLKQLTEKVVRGLTYLEDGTFIEDTHDIEHIPMSEFGARKFCAVLDRFGTTHERPPGLKVRRAVTPQDRVSAMFEIEVWEQLKLYAVVSPKGLPADAP